MAQAVSAKSEKDKAGIIEDERRVEYLKAHIGQVAAAVERGIPVKAYFAWTLMDNYEWAEGHREESRFGLVHVDRKTMKRSKKESAIWYSSMLGAPPVLARPAEKQIISETKIQKDPLPPARTIQVTRSNTIIRRRPTPAVQQVAARKPRSVPLKKTKKPAQKRR